MKHLLTATVLMVAASTMATAQTSDNTTLICKETATPAGYVIIGEATSKGCPNQAWVIKLRGTPANSRVVATDSVRGGAGRVESGPMRIFSPTGQGFSVLMPGTPTLRRRATEAADVKIHELHTDTADYTLLSGPMKFGENSTRDLILNAIFVDYRSSVIEALAKKGIPADMVFDRDLKIGKFPVKQYRVTIGPFAGFARLCATDDHLFLVQIIVISPRTDSAAAMKFLDSFRLVKN